MKRRKRIGIMLLTAVLGLSACGVQGKSTAESGAETAALGSISAESSSDNAENPQSDVEKAAEVAALIDKIYVQSRTESTEEDCKAARLAWDSLTEAQKALVEGENADPDYFGRDTGDASLDNAGNQDEIGEQEILVVSFGTSFNDSRVKDIKGVEDAIARENPDWSIRRAFTSQIILNHILARDGESIDNVEQALNRALKNGVKRLLIQPTHLMRGAEYEELLKTVEEYREHFEAVAVAEPLLGEVGADAAGINPDKEMVSRYVLDAAMKSAGFSSAEDAKKAGTALVLMGHGTSHTAKVSYSQMQTQIGKLGYENVFVGTVEGEPEETACERIIEKAKEAGYRSIVLRPLMLVAGDHANNDMAGEDADSWRSQFLASGSFDKVDCQIEGLGRIPEIQALYMQHTRNAMDELKGEASSASENSDNASDRREVETAALPDGEYTAKFTTDSAMFHVNEALKDLGSLTVQDGEMHLHVSLTSKNIVSLYPGLAADAEKDAEHTLKPTEDSVSYPDGSTELVNGFDVPVPYLGEEFDLALLGKKGKWYDHKVKVELVK